MINPLQIGAWAALLATGLLMAGCAAVLEGNQQVVEVATVPPGASCILDRDGDRVGIIMETPAAPRIERSKRDLTITCRKAGYRAAAQVLEAHYTNMTFYNFIFPGPIGFIWDAAASSDFAYPNAVSIPLQPTATYVPARRVPYHPGARSTFTIPFEEPPR